MHSTVKKRIVEENKSAYQVFNEEIKNIENALLLSKDDYIRERINDVEDIKNRVLRNLVKGRLISKIDENSIVVARSLTPGDTILFSNRNMLGIATDLGGINSHVSIIARSLNIPAVVALKDFSVHVQQGDFLIIDGYKGIVIRNPSAETTGKYEETEKSYRIFEKSLTETENLPCVTTDGHEVKLSTNLEFNNEIDFIAAHIGCDVGLYRTEHMFLESGDFPSENAQFSQYRLLVDHLHPRNITIRTFDIGGDKLLPDTQKELNPFLGWRGIRICLDKRDVFLGQLRAILKASSKHNLKIMFPLINSLEEVLKAKELLEIAKIQLRSEKTGFDENIEVGIMIEVPSAVILADDLARHVDFFSIGTNDLVQYTLAVDRDSSIISNLYQKFHPAVVRSINTVVESAKRNKIPVSVCGEMAGDLYAALLLIGLGVNELSVETASFLRMKRLIRLVNYLEAGEIAAHTLKMDTEIEIREYLVNYYNKSIGDRML
jgi:phosphotransferase system enzyme I (PtsI)